MLLYYIYNIWKEIIGEVRTTQSGSDLPTRIIWYE
jgi:hypothetical protein